MQPESEGNTDLAAALLALLGERVPHDEDLERRAAELIREAGSREKAFLKVTELCGRPRTPRQCYLCTKAYSRLGAKYSLQTIRCAERYLASPGWAELPDGDKMENGIRVNLAARCRAGILMNLAGALEESGDQRNAYYNYIEAYGLEPYNAMCAIKAANVLARLGRMQEAYRFLQLQKRSVYYRPVKYRDALGQARSNDLFRQLIDAHLLRRFGPRKNRFKFPFKKKEG